MADDREVLREVWDGRVPASFSLAPQEVETLTAPEPYLQMLPRLSYLPIVTDKVKKHFAKSVSSEAPGTIWFEFDGSPLRWHIPIGVLFDMAKVANPDLTPPWNITVHYGQYPDKEILKCDSRETVETFFMSSVKESDQIKHGGRVVSSMQKKDHSQLWQGLCNDKFDQFWAVNRRLMESGEDGFKNFPLRMFDSSGMLMRQRLYRTVDPSTKRKALLRDLLRQAALLDHGDEEEDSDNESSMAKVHVVTHGVEPSLDTPLQWMAEHLAYPDNFVYLCIK